MGMILFLGVILEDGQGLFVTVLFGTRPHIIGGLIKIFQTPMLILRSCCHNVDVEQSTDLFPGCDMT